MWSTETRPPTDSQVVTTLVGSFLFPANPGCRKPSCIFESGSALWYVLPCSLVCNRNHDSKVTACSSSIGGPARSGPLIHTFPWPVCVTTIFIFSISSSSLALFLLSLTPTSSSSQSLMLLRRVASCDCRISSSRSSRLGQIAGVVVGEILFTSLVSSCPTVDRLLFACPTLFMVLST